MRKPLPAVLLGVVLIAVLAAPAWAGGPEPPPCYPGFTAVKDDVAESGWTCVEDAADPEAGDPVDEDPPSSTAPPASTTPPATTKAPRRPTTPSQQPVTSVAPVADQEELPFTGGNLWRAVVGGLLLIVGVALVWVNRRKARH